MAPELVVIGIVAHPTRQAQADDLTVAVNPQIVSVDHGDLGVGGNHLNVLRFLYGLYPSDWLVVLEDDAQPVPDLPGQLELALPHAPTPVVSLYCGTGYPAQYQQLFAEAAQEDVCWLLHPQLRHAVGYAIHTSVAKALVNRMTTLVEQRYAPDDAISRWAMENRMDVSYTNPSLVDHEDGPTVVQYRYHLGKVSSPGRTKPRKAYKTGTRLTWDATSVTVRPR